MPTIASADLATLDDLRRHLRQGIPEDEAAAADQALKTAQGAVRTYCGGRMLSAGRKTETRRWDSVLFPHEYPVGVIFSVTVDGNAVSYYTSVSGGIILRAAGTSVDIDYSYGYPDGDPRLEAARTVTLRLAARMLTNPLQRQSQNNDGYSFTGSYDGGAGAPARLLSGDERLMLEALKDDGIA